MQVQWIRGCRFSSNNNDFMTRGGSQASEPGMLSLLLSRSYIQLERFCLPVWYTCYYCTLRVTVSCWLLMWIIDTIAEQDYWLHLSFATDGDCYRKTQPIKKHIFRAQSPWNHLEITPAPKALEALQQRWRHFKTQRTKDFVMRLYILVISENTPIKSHQHAR